MSARDDAPNNTPICTNCGESAKPHPAYADFVGPFCDGCWDRLREYFTSGVICPVCKHEHDRETSDCRALSVVSAVPRDEKDQEDHGGTSLTEGASVSVSVHADQLPHVASQRDAMIAVAQLEQAHREMCDAVQRQWNSGHAFKLSIPANPERDTDLIIGAAIRFAMLVLKPLIGSGTDSSTAKLADERAGALAQEHHSRTPETK